LTPALRWYADVFSKRMGIAASVASQGPEKRLPAIVEEAFFRIAQEALANVAKYAGARNAKVTMRATARSASLSIADDGCGFDPHHAVRGGDHGWGLTLMRERADAVGGELEVASSPGHGTTVTVKWAGRLS
jgi:NarL family two-component system sensor histidine kinase LiaS